MVDFRKAFDLVDHSLLLKQPGLYKCSEEFIKSYLSQRNQVVSINDNTSSASEVTCGVPQGSVIGPLLC